MLIVFPFYTRELPIPIGYMEALFCVNGMVWYGWTVVWYHYEFSIYLCPLIKSKHDIFDSIFGI